MFDPRFGEVIAVLLLRQLVGKQDTDGRLVQVDWGHRVLARRAKQPDLAGSYAGLAEDGVRWPSRHYLGKPVLNWFGNGDTVLLGCGCGDWGCWPFTAIVAVSEDVVVWSGYRTGHRDWDYRELRAITFARMQYESAVRATVHWSGFRRDGIRIMRQPSF